MAPITISGPILSPKVSVKKGGMIAQGGAALALGALLSPAALLVPFVDAGLAKDANCASLLAEGQAHGAPVKSRAGRAQSRWQARRAPVDAWRADPVTSPRGKGPGRDAPWR